MTEKDFNRAKEIRSQLTTLKLEVNSLENMNGNFWFIGLGQDKQTCKEFKTNKRETEQIIKQMILARKGVIAILEHEFNEI